MAISKCIARALYYDLSEVTGLYVEEYIHLAQNERDLDEIAMRVLGVLGEASDAGRNILGRQLVSEGSPSLGCCSGSVFSLSFSAKGSVGYVESRCMCCFR